MPHTAYLMARSLGLHYNRGLLTGNPNYNIRLGSHYLKTLLDRYRGETALAVAAYNAGPRRVDEWLRLHGDPRRGDRYDADRLDRADPVRRDPQLRPAGARRAQHVPPAAGRAGGRDGLVPAGQRPARSPAGAALKPREHARAGRARDRCSPGRPRPALKPIDRGPDRGAGRVRGAAAARSSSRAAVSNSPLAAPAACSPLPAAQAGRRSHDRRRMAGIRACVFDAYGTLFDVHSAVGRLRAQIGARGRRALRSCGATKQLEYSWLRALMGRHADFWQVTGDALDYALARTGVDPGRCARRCSQAYLTLDAYPEVPDVLAPPAGGRPQDRDPVQRRAQDARRPARGAPASTACSTRSSRSRRSASSSPSRGSTSSRSTGWACRRRRSPSSRRTPGTSTAPPASGCARSGSTASAPRPSACPGPPSTSCAISPVCRRCSGSEPRPAATEGCTVPRPESRGRSPSAKTGRPTC